MNPLQMSWLLQHLDSIENILSIFSFIEDFYDVISVVPGPSRFNVTFPGYFPFVLETFRKTFWRMSLGPCASLFIVTYPSK